MTDDLVTLTIPAFTVPAEGAGAYDRACDAIERARVLGAEVYSRISRGDGVWVFTVRAVGTLDQVQPLTGLACDAAPRPRGIVQLDRDLSEAEVEEFRARWNAAHAAPCEPVPSDEQVRAFLERHPAAFRGFADRERRRDPGWLRGVLRRDARIHGGRAEWPD